MNNLFQAFSIKVPGQYLDDTMFYDYADFDPENIAVPTDEQTHEKAKAFIRLKQLKRKLSELSVPIYSTVTFATPGTTATIPTDAEIVVAYISYEPFLSTLETAPSNPTVDAAAVIQKIIEDTLKEEIANEFLTVQLTVDRKKTALPSSGDEKFRELRTIYLTAPAVVVTPTVTYIEIKA